MRVMLVSQHFGPEITAASFRLESFAERLAARGHEMHVVCAVPNHPEGLIQPPYRGRLLARERSGRVRVWRTWTFARPEKTLRTRVATYGSFAAGAAVAGSFAPRPDVVLASSPPLTVAMAGAALAARFGVPLVLDVRDLWPESATALGELPDGRVVAALRRAERAVYRRASQVVTTNPAFAAHIAAVAGDDMVRVAIVPNGTTREWIDAGRFAPDRAGAGLPADRFAWTYAGNLGLAHGIETAVEAAGLLGEEYRLTIIGTGPRRGDVERAAAGLPAGLVEIRPLAPPSRVAGVLRASDAVLVSERQPGTISAKLYDCCAVRRPIVAAVNGEMGRLVGEAGIGLVVPHGDSGALATAIRRLRSDPQLAARLVPPATAFAAANVRSDHGDRLAELVERATVGRHAVPGRLARA